MTRLLIGEPKDGMVTNYDGPIIVVPIVRLIHERYATPRKFVSDVERGYECYRYRSYKLRSGNRTYEILVGEDVTDDEVFDYMIKNYRPVAKCSEEQE